MSAPRPTDDASERAQHLAARVHGWQLRRRRLAFGQIPLVMGILNVTPDSFSDGGRFVAVSAAVEHGLRLAAEGADLLDIGGESTRPYSDAISADEELRRVLPVIEKLASQVSIPISIDTSKSVVARAALEAGAEIINDVTALRHDVDMVEVARTSSAGVCVMHMQGNPGTMQDNPTYDDVVGEVVTFLRQRRDQLIAQGINLESIALDPGIGFGKTHAHNLTLVAHSYQLHELGCPVLVGHSRKSFINKVLGDKAADPLSGTIGVALALAGQGIQILRLHDVGAARQALLLFEAAGGLCQS